MWGKQESPAVECVMTRWRKCYEGQAFTRLRSAGTSPAVREQAAVLGRRCSSWGPMVRRGERGQAARRAVQAEETAWRRPVRPGKRERGEGRLEKWWEDDLMGILVFLQEEQKVTG